MSDKTFAWLAGSLIGAVAVLAVLIANMKAISAVLPWIAGALGLVLLLIGLYKAWHHMSMKKLEREKLAAEVALLENDRWVASQTLLGEWQVAEKKIELERELELERIRLEQMRAANEHTRLMAATSWQQQHVLVPEGHTVVFLDEQPAMRTIANPRTPAQIAQRKQDESVKVMEEKAAALIPPRNMPGTYDLVDMFRRYTLTPDRMFLGLADEGEPLFVDSGEQLCHGVFSAVTGRGKTIIERGLEAQLLHFGHEVIHLDLKFTLVDKDGLDYRPLARALVAQPDIVIPGYNKPVPHLVLEMEDIYEVLRWLADVEIPRRLKLFHAGIHNYPVLYAFLEELLFLVSKYPDAAKFIGDIVVIGRSLGIKLFTAAQNFQSQSTNIAGGMAENFETAYFCGGDNLSGAKVLDVTQKTLNLYLQQNSLTLGKGLVLLRNNTVAPTARLARVGMASNDAIYYLLGRADNFVLPGTVTGTAGNLAPKTDDSPAYQRPTEHATSVVEADISRGTLRNTGPIGTLPKTPVNAPVDESGRIAGDGPDLGPDDKIFTPEQEADFLARMAKLHNVKECLRTMMNNETRRPGLSNRYHRYASWLADKHNLRKDK